jgi:hypothetical protein
VSTVAGVVYRPGLLLLCLLLVLGGIHDGMEILQTDATTGRVGGVVMVVGWLVG